MATDSDTGSLDNDLSESAPLLVSRLGVSNASQVSYGATVIPSQETESTELTSSEEGILYSRANPNRGLPPGQLLILFALRFTSPMAFSQIFPYVNEMMAKLDASIDPSQVGYYSGLVESVFAFSQFFTILRWGMLSDRIGRKPVMLACFLGVFAFNISFGLSKSLFWALASRAAAGALSGGSTAILSAVGDVADEESQAHIYSVLGLASTLGSILGPAIGGAFANPESNFPDSIGKIQMFCTYPYLFPCVISSTLVLGAIIACSVWFEETLPVPVIDNSQSPDSLKEDIPSDARQSAWDIALNPTFAPILAGAFFLNLSGNASNAVFSLFAYTPVERGGLSQEPLEIGMAIASTGLLASALQIALLPILQQQLGTVVFFRSTMSLWPVLYVFFPFVHKVALLTLPVEISSALHFAVGDPMEQKRLQHERFPVWAAIFALLMIQRLAFMAYPLNLMLTKNAAPSDKVLGTVFGLSSLAGCLARILSPALASSLFAYSVEKHVMDGNFVWFAMTAISIVGLYVAWRVHE